MTPLARTKLVMLNAAAAALPQIRRVDAGAADWVLIRGVAPAGGARGAPTYMLTRAEFFRRLQRSPVPYSPTTRATLEQVLQLKTLRPMAQAQTSGTRRFPVAVDIGLLRMGPKPGRNASLTTARNPASGFGLSGPAAARPTVTVRTERPPQPPRFGTASGGASSPAAAPAGRPTASRSRKPASMPAPMSTPRAMPMPMPEAEPPAEMAAPMGSADSAPPATGSDAPPAAMPDEGTQPLRYPSIDAQAPLASGQSVTLVVDLRREESEHTAGATAFPEMAADWQEFRVEVALSSPDVEFDAEGRAELRVRRNADSVPAQVTGRVRAGLAPGHVVQVKARFLLERRLCGSAVRQWTLADAPGPAPAKPQDAQAVHIDPRAAGPDLAVEISIADPDKPARLVWSMWPVDFPGCPPRLNGVTHLGQRPDLEASALFARFAKLQRGEHREAIEGFGEELWNKAPAEFQALYWAMCDHFQRPLTIQFITDDPYLPWELMTPHRGAGPAAPAGESHGTLALRHAVARWLLSYKGYLDNRLPGGRLLAMAPRYGVGRDLPLAQAATQALIDTLKAERIEGKRALLLGLLQTPSPERVALLFFNGHGAFSSDTAGASVLKLEDGSEITPMEVKRQQVSLGQRDGTVVFLNACEVGASGSVLGNVGGWADAFLAREFRAFIAPLWAIDEEDGTQVTAELMDAIVTRREPIGAALRDLRAKYGAVSPTFYSYLYYGDVTARLGTA